MMRTPCLKDGRHQFAVNPTRQNAITRGTLAEEFTGDMDDAAWHLESIQEKGCQNEINAYNHGNLSALVHRA